MASIIALQNSIAAGASVYAVPQEPIASMSSSRDIVSDMTRDERAMIDAERSRIEESMMYPAEGQIEASKMWTSLHWILGGSTAIASGVTAVLTFAAGDLQVLAGCLALLAAMTAAIHVTLRPDKRAERAHADAAKYKSLQSAARRFAIDTASRPVGDARASLEALAADADAVNQTADPIPGFAYWRAKRNIAAGGQSFKVDA